MQRHFKPLNPITKKIHGTIRGTKSQWQLHEDVTYMNISSIQISLCGTIILQLLLQINDVVTLII